MRRMCGNVRKGNELWDEEVSVAVKRKRQAYEEWLQIKSRALYER